MRVTDEVEGWLSGCGLGKEVMNAPESIECGKRVALAVAAAVDPTGEKSNEKNKILDQFSFNFFRVDFEEMVPHVSNSK